MSVQAEEQDLGDLRVFNFRLIGHVEQLDRDNAAELTTLDKTYMMSALKGVKWALVEPEIYVSP